MTDKIAYLLTTSGEDGRAKEKIAFAAWTEKERDDAYDNLPRSYKPWYSKSKRIVEVEVGRVNALKKLDGVDRLLLDLEQKV